MLHTARQLTRYRYASTSSAARQIHTSVHKREEKTQARSTDLGVVTVEVGVVDAVELDGVVDVGNLADVKLVCLTVVKRLLQLLPAVPHH